MKITLRLLTCFLFLILIFPPATLHAQGHDRCKMEEIIEAEAKQWERKRLFKEHGEAEFNYDVKYYRTYWEVDPRQFYIKGYVTMYFVPNEELNVIKLDLSHDLTVDSILYHTNKLGWTLGLDDILETDLGQTSFTGALDSISVYYQGIPVSGSNAFVQAFLGDMPVMWTLSEPFGAKDWWPCKQSLDDKADSVDIYVKTPRPYKVGSNGLLAGQWQQDTMITYYWKHRYPIVTYLVGIAVSEYSVVETHIKGVESDSFLMLDYLFPQDSANQAPNIPTTASMMQVFAKNFGPYPFEKEKYGHVQFLYGGGMEHQTMSFMRHLGFTLVAHELAHHWFGNKITCGSWEDIWLNEGFASWSESFALEKMRTKEEVLKWRKDEIAYATSSPAGSVKVDDTTSRNRIFNGRLTYSKGGIVVQMLRYLMGDSLFFQGIRNYMQDPALAYGFAKTPDLIRHMEEVYGKSLEWFFREWYEGEGYPVYNIGWKMRNNVLTVEMQQSTTSGFVRLYHMPVPLKIWRQGKDTTIRLAPNETYQVFEIDLPGYPVDSIQADPEYHLMAKYTVKNMDTTGKREAKIYPNPGRDYFYVDLQRNGPLLNTVLEIFDAQGRQVMREEGLLPNKIRIDGGFLSQGLYIVRVKNDEVNFTGKLVIARP